MTKELTRGDSSEAIFTNIYAAALYYLAIREHSQAQLLQKLSVKFPEDQSLINQAIAKLASDNDQSDSRFAAAYLYARAQRGNGPKKITYELKVRGISQTLIDSAFEKCDIDWNQVKEKTRQKKFGPEPLPTEFLRKAKQLTYLQQRGF